MVSLHEKISPPVPWAECESPTMMSNTSSRNQRHLSEAIDSVGWRCMWSFRGRARVRFVVLGDENVRVGSMASQLSSLVNLNEVSLGQRGSSVDRIPRKEIVSEDTSTLFSPRNFPTDSSTTRAAYPLNRSHSFGVGVLVIR